MLWLIILIIIIIIYLITFNETFINVLRHTKNMSYDLRGDPIEIQRDGTYPWNNSELSPIYNKSI